MKLSHPFSTDRMNFRILTMADLDVVYRQFSDPDMCKYFSEPPVDLKEAEEIIEHYKEPDGKGYLRYGMFDKTTEAFIGTVGYHYWEPDRKQVEIGYDIWKDYWRQGYISEAIPPLLDICFEHLGVDYVYILTHPDNHASIKSVTKQGFIECPPLREIDVEPQICLKLPRIEWNNRLSF